MTGIGLRELGLVLGVVLLVFGRGRLLDLGKTISKAMRSFKSLGDRIPGSIDE